jgi:glycosyltransferase involved in cell wall biosynthesis
MRPGPTKLELREDLGFPLTVAKSPLVSIVMPVWNGADFIAEALESILAQTFQDFELVVVDDGSTDRTPDILKACADPRLRVRRLDHAGIVKALNFGVSEAKAEWIARQDADDISLPRRLEVQWERLRRNPAAVLAHTEIDVIGHVTGPVKRPRFPSSRAFLALKLCFVCPITHSTVMFRKSAFLEAGGYRPEERHAEDYALWGRLLSLGDFIGIREKLVRFRVHPQSVSKQNLEAQLALTKRIAIEHCRRFMSLSNEDAAKAHEILTTPGGNRAWGDWWWFLTRCAPRLRWKSAETYSWLLWQTARQGSRL